MSIQFAGSGYIGTDRNVTVHNDSGEAICSIGIRSRYNGLVFDTDGTTHIIYQQIPNGESVNLGVIAPAANEFEIINYQECGE